MLLGIPLTLPAAGILRRHRLVGLTCLSPVRDPHFRRDVMPDAAAWAILCGLWQLDEMQRRIQFDAIAISFLGTALVTFGWGFAERAGLPQLRAFAVWPIMGISWGLGLFVAQRRYPVNNRIKELRLGRDWGQGNLAQALSDSRQTVNAIENGRYDPSLRLAFTIPSVFGLRIEDVFQPLRLGQGE